MRTCFLLLILALCSALLTACGTTVTEERTYPTKNLHALSLSNDTGAVTVRPTTDNRVHITAKENVPEESDASLMRWSVDRSRGALSISTDNQGMRPYKAPWSLDFEIEIPRDWDVSIDASGNDGTIDLADLSGSMDLKATSTLKGRNLTLRGKSSMSVEGSSDLDVEAVLDSRGTYRFDTYDGSLDLTLPSDASFALDAASQKGRIDNDFGTRATGKPPRPPLELDSYSGGIHLHRG